MITHIAAETLKSGETLHIELVIPPDEERDEQILPFLAHKPPHFRGHIEAAFSRRCDDLETRFYIGLIDGRMVGNIMTVETDGIGILGHVHTAQNHRRKGIASHIMAHQMADFWLRDGHTLLLGTGYQSPAYYIYETFGFRDWTVGRPGLMRCENPADPDFEARYFAPAPTTPVTARWKHWPLAALVASLPANAYFRSLTFDLRGVGLLEGPYCRFIHDYGAAQEARASVLEAGSGAVFALGTNIPDARWRGDVRLLDLFAHPVAPSADLRALIGSLLLPGERTQCYADPRDPQKIEALEQSGFRIEATLTEQIREGDAWRDILLYGRNG